VHYLAVHLAPVLAAEKSKTAYYIAGGALVAWALIVSLLLGLRKPDFPNNLGGQRVVMAITAVLVIGAASTAVITSGSPEAKGEGGSLASESISKQSSESANKPSTLSPGSSPVKQEPSGPTGTGPTSGKPPAPRSSAGKSPKQAKSPKATTGTPAPPSSPAAAATTLKLAANPAGQLSYDTKQLSAKAGKVTIDMSNSSPVEHDVAVAQGSQVLGQTPVFTGGSKSVALTLKPGTYTFYCTVPGHRQAGMEGTLTVQ
jgi:plastocyanin